MTELKNYQKDLWAALSGAGVKPGEFVIYTGRNSGKSHLIRYMAQWQELMGEKIPYKKLDQSLVDGKTWYTIKCNSEVARWLRDRLDHNSCYEHIAQSWHVERNTFDICESVYIQLGLKFA
jgi:hypothetical protein